MTQNTRSKRVVEDREFDNTSLTAKSHGHQVHRDYAAHYFRWGFVKKFLKRGMTVLDVGCGEDTPLIKSLAGGPGVIAHLPKRYVGIDYNEIKNPPNRPWAEFITGVNFIKDHKKILGDEQFDLIVNLEVIEHMDKKNGLKLLKAMRTHLKPGGKIFLSTPIFNGSAAANHIHEYEAQELMDHFKKAKLVVVDRWGTFASCNDIKKVLTKEQRKDYDRLRTFYDNDVAACFYAPLYPDASRNNAWLLSDGDN